MYSFLFTTFATELWLVTINVIGLNFGLDHNKLGTTFESVFASSNAVSWSSEDKSNITFSSNNTTIQGIGSSGWICMVNTSAIHNKGSEKWGVNETVPHDKKLD
jgi:hypothetical protein